MQHRKAWDLENKSEIPRLFQRMMEIKGVGSRQTSRESMKKRYHERRAAMTEEELAAERERLRLKMKAYRERKKAEKLAQQEAEKKGTV